MRPARPGSRLAGVAALAYLAVVGSLIVAAGQAERLPTVPSVEVLALVGPPLGAGLLGRSWWLVALVPAPVVIAFALLATGDEDRLEEVLVAFVLSAAALVLVPVGVALARPGAAAAATGATLLAGGLLVVPASLLARDRDVRVERKAPLIVDERAGTYRGVALGDSLSAVRRRLGPGRRDVVRDPLALRYDDVELLLDDRRRVRELYVTDRQAATRRGVGVGDGLERWRDAYPALRCDEGAAGSDFPTPFPLCTLALPAGRRLEIHATYDDPGKPVTLLRLRP